MTVQNMSKNLAGVVAGLTCAGLLALAPSHSVIHAAPMPHGPYHHAVATVQEGFVAPEGTIPAKPEPKKPTSAKPEPGKSMSKCVCCLDM